MTPLSTRSIACLATLAALAATTLLMTGCDTVALISFQERQFSDVRTPGITPAAGQCTGSTGDMTLRFVLEADDELPILPGDVVGQQELNLEGGDISLSESALFEYPDVACDTNDDCRFMGSNFTCTTAREGLGGDQRRCLRSASLTLQGEPEFESDLEKPQLFGVIFENSGSLEGWLPEDVGLRYPDTDGDGTADGSRDTAPDTKRASDPDGRRDVALTGIRDTFAEASRFAEAQGDRRTLFGLWQFSGTSTADVRSLVAQTTSQNALWARDPATFAAAQAAFDSPGSTRANVYQALESVIDDGFGLDEFDGFEKTLVVFVDGPDDLRLGNFTADDVIEKATEQGIRVFIVHLDAAVQTESGNVTLIRDDFQYWQNQDAACGSGEDCLNYETCRVPTAYASDPGGAVDISTTDTYCMVERDQNGRVGPIFDYQRIACETDGGYIYVKTARALRRRMEWLPLTMDGLWKINGVVDVVENGQVPEDEGFGVQSNLSITAGGTTRSFLFAQGGDPGAGRENDDQDTRTVLFVD